MSLVMLTEPAKFSVEGDSVRVTVTSGTDEWAFCLSRYDFNRSLAEAVAVLDCAEIAEETKIVAMDEYRAAH